jgi:hypothetical protein
MGQMSTEEAIRAYEQILRDPNSTPQQRAVAEMALKALRGY